MDDDADDEPTSCCTSSASKQDGKSWLCSSCQRMRLHLSPVELHPRLIQHPWRACKQPLRSQPAKAAVLLRTSGDWQCQAAGPPHQDQDTA